MSKARRAKTDRYRLKYGLLVVAGISFLGAIGGEVVYQNILKGRS